MAHCTEVTKKQGFNKIGKVNIEKKYAFNPFIMMKYKLVNGINLINSFQK